MRLALIFMVMFLGVSVAAHAACVNPAGAPGDFFYSEDHRVFQGCTVDGWYAFTTPHVLTDPCLDAGVTPGTVCASGAVYAGVTPDGNVPMYTTPADAGLFAWNNANWNADESTYTVTGQTSNVTGDSNTAALITIDSDAVVPGIQPHRAAQHCADLIAHGHGEWYQPALDELNVLRGNRHAIGNFDLSGEYPGGWYWSSSEHSNRHARPQRFSDGVQTNSGGKHNAWSLRCVSKTLAPVFGPTAPCTNPAAPIGSVFYNIDHRVFQGCTHFGWQAFHMPAPVPAQPENADTCVNPTGKQGAIFYNQDYKVFQGCTANGWYPFHDPCDGNSPPGTRCDDGSYKPLALQEVQSKSTPGQTNPASITLDNVPAPGNLLVVIGAHRSDIGDNTISGTGWTQHIYINAFSGDTANRRGLAIWSKIAGPSEPQTITVDFGANTSSILVHEFSLPGVTPAIDVMATNVGGTVDVNSISTGTTAVSSTAMTLSIAAFVARDPLGGAPSWSNEFEGSTLAGDTFLNLGFAYKLDYTAGSRESTASWPNNRDTSAAIVVFSLTP